MYLKNIFIFFLFAVILGGAFAGVNYFVDANCYYRCDDFYQDKRTINPYYQLVQWIDRDPSQDVLIIGSSRAGTTSSTYVARKTGLKVLNVSAPAADLALREGYLERVLSRSDRVPQRVIWYSDFLELSISSSEPKVAAVDAFRNKFNIKNDDAEIFKIQKLIDRLSFETSIGILLGHSKLSLEAKVDDVDLEKCLSKDFSGLVTQDRLKAELGLMYSSYTSSVFKGAMISSLQRKFEHVLKKLIDMNVHVDVVITPYHPAFKRRLKEENPQLYEEHKEWVKYLQGFANGGQVRVYDYYTEGFPNDDEGPLLWDDGVHFNCFAAIQIINKIF